MDKLNSTPRFSLIEAQTVLTQTDTTVGFSSQNHTKLVEIKTRVSTKPFIKLYQDFKTLKEQRVRVPNTQKNRIRRSKKTTFIVKGASFRVAKTTLESSVLRDLKWNYSTSANESGKSFERNFCEEKADIIVEDKNSLFEGVASKLLMINSKKIKRLR